ncbi:peptidyl-Lys metalloendopeptidase [Rhizoctonia solani AG-1 IB]|uniref:Peptidyl-Lys metalloendopeptidase n=1 Tax=Thanatephorus cucumeris (strain AG1-IB / isolate 7/3/14) TaxID=1108050 RepID=A0A0B7FU75_THACB|nr:peptidyl-Lys metalloendopeptidase [Rhizoctonia solani AG-1 IB]
MKSAVSAVLLSAIAVSAAPSLVLDVAGPNSIVDVNGLTVKATLKNTGDVSLKLLNDPRTILSKARTNTFSISSTSGTPKFTGLKVKYVPSKAAALNTESSFTVLAPGQSIEIDHDLAGVYNFTQSGEGAYNFGATNVFNYVDATGELKTIEASSNTHQFKLAGKLAVPHGYTNSISRRAVTYTGCTSTQQSQISTAATSSNTYVANANSYLAGISSGTTRYTTWFGAFASSRYNTVVSHYKNIGTDATSSNYDCTACKSEPGIDYSSTFAYVNPGSPGKIYLCGAFWSAPNTGTDSRAGTIVHENSHFTVNGGTDDHVYGQSSAKSLAKSNPAQAIDNADNHEYFAENTPALS